MPSEKLIQLDEEISRLELMINRVRTNESTKPLPINNVKKKRPENKNETTNGGTQTEEEVEIMRLGKLEKILRENKKLKEQIGKLESSVTALNSSAANKENKLHHVLKTQRDLERNLTKKVSELKHIVNESEKYKDTATNRIMVLEEKCEKLNKKVTVQNEELNTYKEKYAQLKKKLFGYEMIQKEKKNKKHRSIYKVEMVSQGIQVEVLDNETYDKIIANLFFLPSPPSSPTFTRSY